MKKENKKHFKHKRKRNKNFKNKKKMNKKWLICRLLLVLNKIYVIYMQKLKDYKERKKRFQI